MENNKGKIDKIFKKFTHKKEIHESILHIENLEGDFSYSKAYGDTDGDTPFLMASITKLVTTACIYILQEQGKLSLDDPLATYIQDEVLHHLHYYKGRDYSKKLTLSNLLFQTSGLPDISEEGVKILRKHIIHRDMKIDFDDIIKMTKQQKPHFSPTRKKRSHYADVNFDLLGKIVEVVTHSTLSEVYKELIFDPLGLNSTYLPESEQDFIPRAYYKNTSLYRPKFIRSCHASGGCISTARELMIFIKAFFSGTLFNKVIFNNQKEVNRLQVSMFPIHYGAGYMVIPLGGFASLFMGKGELLGHSGSSGSFAFYYPREDLFFVGNVNQMSNPALPIRLAMRLAFSMTS